MKKKYTELLSVKELAADWGIDYQAYKIKAELIDKIKSHCEKHDLSQRKLASLVPGLSQDRVSKIFSGQVGHMTIDKLIEILSVLNYRITVNAKAT